MAKPVATKVLAAVPAGYHDKVILEVFAFEHAQDHHAGAAFAVVVFLGRAVDDSRPSVVGGFSEFLSVVAPNLGGFLPRLLVGATVGVIAAVVLPIVRTMTQGY